MEPLEKAMKEYRLVDSRVQQKFLIETASQSGIKDFFWTEEKGTVAGREEWRFIEEKLSYGLKLLS